MTPVTIWRVLLALLLAATLALVGCGKKGKIEPLDDAPPARTQQGR